MSGSHKVRMNRLFRNGRCLDVAIDHGIANEPTFYPGLENITRVMADLVKAGPDAIQVNYGQADLLQNVDGKDKPALVMRTDIANGYNTIRHRFMWATLQNAEEPILAALQMDAAAVVVNIYMIPDEPEMFKQCIENIAKLRRECEKYAMPLMIEPLAMQAPSAAGGYQVDGDTSKIVNLVRLAQEIGADIIKADPTDVAEDFHKVVEAARVPVLVRGGGKGELKGVFQKSAVLMQQGAAGMVYGRNVYQHDNPSRVVAALMAMIHDGADAERANAIYEAA